MNIFYLSHDPVKCASEHNDKHVVKMILEYTQLLSTAHRLLDGKETIIISPENKKRKIYLLQDEKFHWDEFVEFDEEINQNVVRYKLILSEPCYVQTHVNHPSAVWTRLNSECYDWLYRLLVATHDEYTYRYDKIHKSSAYLGFLKNPPKNIPQGNFRQPPQAMPDEYRVVGDSIKAYRQYYIGAKSGMAKWKNRNKPVWYVT